MEYITLLHKICRTLGVRRAGVIPNSFICEERKVVISDRRGIQNQVSRQQIHQFKGITKLHDDIFDCFYCISSLLTNYYY